MTLRRFAYVDDTGDLHLDTAVTTVKKDMKYGCGIYTFEKNHKKNFNQLNRYQDLCIISSARS